MYTRQYCLLVHSAVVDLLLVAQVVTFHLQAKVNKLLRLPRSDCIKQGPEKPGQSSRGSYSNDDTAYHSKSVFIYQMVITCQFSYLHFKKSYLVKLYLGARLSNSSKNKMQGCALCALKNITMLVENNY